MSKDDCSPTRASVDAQREQHAPKHDGSRGLPRVVRSDALLAGASQLAILHNDTLYFLRETRFGKLILTK
jgi:hemin uptake protein HemP